MVLQLRRVHLVFRIVGRVLVEVGQQDRLRVGRFDVFARAAVAVSAGADFVVETAVDFVLFGAEDGGEVAVCEGGKWLVELSVWGRLKTGEGGDKNFQGSMKTAYLAIVKGR